MAQKTYAELAAQATEIKDETTANANTATRVGTILEDMNDSIVSREFNRTFSEEIDFNKNEIYFSPTELTTDINFSIGSDNLVDQTSSARVIIITDGTHAINFGGNMVPIYGFVNGAVPDAGTYEIYFLYVNGNVTVSFPGVSFESSGASQLAAPANFAAVADGETAIDLSWDDVANEVGYLIEYSLTGSGGWTTLSTPAAGSTTETQTGLSSGVTRYYRIKAVGDGVDHADSAYSQTSGTTENSGDVTAPTFTFLPANGNTTWTVNEEITLTANEAIRNTDGSEITNANVASRLTLKETNSGGSDIAFTATIDVTKTIITITPTTHYGQNQLVYVAINNVEDVNGNEVTVAISATFTTTEYTLFNGTSNRISFGDILDSVFAVPDTNFEFEVEISNYSLSGFHMLFVKTVGAGTNEKTILVYQIDDELRVWYFLTASNTSRNVSFVAALDGSDIKLTVEYDGSIDTNDGLDRVTVLIDDVDIGAGTLASSNGTLGSTLRNVAGPLGFGIQMDGSGTPVSSSWFNGEAKNLIVRSNSGATVEINVPNIRSGVDTSGNANHGTWA